MKREHLPALKAILENSTRKCLPDDRFLPYVLLTQDVLKKFNEHQETIKTLQKECNVVISEVGVLAKDTKPEDIEKLQKLVNEYNQGEVKIDPIFNEDQVLAFSKENNLTGYQVIIVYENLMRSKQIINTKKSKEDGKQD